MTFSQLVLFLYERNAGKYDRACRRHERIARWWSCVHQVPARDRIERTDAGGITTFSPLITARGGVPPRFDASCIGPR